MLGKIYLSSASRGLGLGWRTLEFVRNQALIEGRTSIRLTVDKKNIQAITFYERVGFRVVGEIREAVGNGYFIEDYSMEWNL